MDEKTYILSPDCQLLNPEELEQENLPPGEEIEDLLAGRLFVLEEDGNYHLINPTIKAFLDAFISPTTLVEVINRFAAQVGCEPVQIEAAMSSFLKEMRKNGFLIEVSNETKVNHPSYHCSFEEGQVVNEYQLKSLIFEKSELDIYIAENLENGQQVALKLMKKGSESVRKTFLNEFQLMQELGAHPHVCGCYGWHSSEQYCYGILEYIEGKSLRSHIKHENFGLEERLVLAGQVLSALSFVHEKKLLHGDIHLSNFMVESSTNHVKLIDFNMANREKPAEKEFIWEGGVYQYIPPEKADGRAFRYVTERSDYISEAWQAGVVLYYIFYDELPFNDFAWPKLARKIREEEPSYADTILTGEALPEWVLAFLRKSLEKDPRRRFASAIQQHNYWKKSSKRKLHSTLSLSA